MSEAEPFISVTEAAHRLGVTGVEVFERVASGELVGLIDDGGTKLPVDQPALQPADQVTLTRKEALDVLAALELARARLGTVDFLDDAHQVMTRSILNA
jgi:hypothetical protein